MTKERQWPRTAAAEQPKLTTTTTATARSLVVVRNANFMPIRLGAGEGC